MIHRVTYISSHRSPQRGQAYKEIAYKPGITEWTVKAYLASIYQKFGVDSRAVAVAVAAQKGLLGSKFLSRTQ
jgi:DNA-binding NarL/FixJ family response regulator